MNWCRNLVAVPPLLVHVQLNCYMLPTVWCSLKQIQYFIQMHRQIVILFCFPPLLWWDSTSLGLQLLFWAPCLKAYALPTALCCCCCSQSCSSEHFQKLLSISILCISKSVFAAKTPMGCCEVLERVDTESTSANHRKQKRGNVAGNFFLSPIRGWRPEIRLLLLFD